MNQKGFTLIELVVVIVVLGILAAVAVPKFIDLSEEADKAAVKGVAGALGSASAINYAAAKTGSTEATDATDCELQANLLEGGLDANYSINTATVSGDTLSVDVSPLQCVVQTVDAPTYSAAFTAFYVSQ